MKRRNRNSRQRFGSSLRKPLELLNIGKQQKRKHWTFEKLEDRLVFSTSTYQNPALQLQTVSYGNDTPEGAAMTWLAEQEWNAVQAAAAAGLPAPDYVLLSLPNDPLFPNEWNLVNTGQEVGNPDLQHLFGVAGQDINVIPAWNLGVTGQGIKVGVIDSGVQITHPDLIANISPTLRYNADTGTSSVNPDVFFDPEAGHGTSVAGIIGATDNNGIGISGIAPDVTIVPIKLNFTPLATTSIDDQIANAFQYALQHGVDITNNSYGPSTRQLSPLSDAEATALRNAAIFGRNGLGMINVFASGNDGGPSFSINNLSVGNYSSSSYNGFANSRYVITVGGTDEDGQYQNADGTFTSYPEIGPNVLVVAPTGSNGVLTIGNDNGYGSGIWTTDLVGDQGFNAAPLPNGTDDNDPLPNPDYTSRFNGTSAATPEVSAVVALMLQANPNLTYRDVQEILVRSARQNAEFETPSSGSLLGPRTTWQVNQIGPFRDPDPWNDQSLYPLPVFGPGLNPFEAIADPLANPGLEGGGGLEAADSNDGDRQSNSRYESEPPQYTNGAGFTVSQGYGIYSEQVGYAHGVIDAGLAVEMAKQWTTLGQDLAPNTEKTFTTSIVDYGGGLNLPAAEKMAVPNGAMLVPGGIGGLGGFIAYWNEFFKPVTIDQTTGVPDPTTGPFSEDVPPVDTRGLSYLDFNVPPPQEINVEWVEVKLKIAGPSTNLPYMRIMLASPEGTQSDFNEYWSDPGFGSPISWQPVSTPGDAGNAVWRITPGQPLTGGDLVWTFSTNRDWGETTNSAVVLDPVSGEPILGADGQPIFRNWELHIENWGGATMSLQDVEIVWHGKPIGGGSLDPNYGAEGVANAQRIQGFVGIDTNGDNQFNYGRYLQTVADPDQDPTTVRLLDVNRTQDFNDNNQNGVYDSGDTINQEPFAENVVVDAYRVWDGVAEAAPVARFLTGADGNYYFDLDVQGDLAQTGFGKAHAGQTLTYQIRATDPLGRAELEDIDTPAEQTLDPSTGYTYLPHYKQVWTITPDWFYAPDRDNLPLTLANNPGEILFDPTTGAPVPWTNNGVVERVPMAVKNINFLLKQDAPANNFDVNGTVYSDVNGNGKFDGTDAPAADIYVYWDQNRNGVFDQGETRVLTDANGQYLLNIDLTTLPSLPTTNSTYQIGVIKPNSNWKFTDPGLDGIETVFAGPGSPVQTVNFFVQPPTDPFPNGGTGLGSIQGIVFNDLNQNGIQDPGEPGVVNFRVFIDTNHDGVYQSTETSTLTSSLGTYFFANVQPGTIRLDVVIPNEFTDNAAWSLTTPSLGYREVALGAGGALTNVFFGLDNRADKDWGDLPNSYQTTAAANGPSHVVVPGFQLGPSIDGEVNGVPTPLATGEGEVGDDDDGVHVVSNGGILVKGTNTLNVMVQGVGGLLTGWMDFNGDGHFDESERLQWSLNGTSLGGEADINPGTYNLQITIPASATNGPIAARFRWGEQGLSFAGPAAIGEVEDYFFGLNYIYGDYDRNGVVDLSDYNVWRHQKGTNVTPFSGADGNGDGVVNQADYDVWRAHFGQSLPSPGAGSSLAAGSGSSGTLSAGGSGVGLGSGVGISSAFSSLSSVSTVSSSLQSATMASGASSSSLLLNDLAFGDIDSASFHTSDDSLYSDSTHTEDHPSDLALASVLGEDSSWWNVN